LNIDKLNTELRNLLIGLVEKGYKKTDIGRLLLGSNGYGPISKFISQTDNRVNFGAKPLSRIAEQAGYTLELAFVKKGKDSRLDAININNDEFLEELPSLIENYLNGEYNKDMQKTRKSKAVSAISEILSELGL